MLDFAFFPSPPSAGFGEAGAEFLIRGPGPIRLGIRRGVENVDVLFAFVSRPGLMSTTNCEPDTQWASWSQWQGC